MSTSPSHPVMTPARSLEESEHVPAAKDAAIPKVLTLAEAAALVRCSRARLCNIVHGKIGPVCDAWLMVAELALLAHSSRVGPYLGDQTVYDHLRRPARRSAEDGAVVDRYSSRLVRQERTTDVVISKALEAGSTTRFEKSPLCSSIETAYGRSGDWLQYILIPNRGVDVRAPSARLRQRQRRGLKWSASVGLRSRTRNGLPRSIGYLPWRSSFAGG